MIDVYIFRRAGRSGARGLELLQLLRAKAPLKDTWHPVMGHIEAGETAVAAALREVEEETGLSRGSPSFLGAWALEQVHPFYIAAVDCIVLSPRFAVEVDRRWTPRLNHEHAGRRWVPASAAAKRFMWPGQLAVIEELKALLRPGSLARGALEVR